MSVGLETSCAMPLSVSWEDHPYITGLGKDSESEFLVQACTNVMVSALKVKLNKVS